jgi:transposase
MSVPGVGAVVVLAYMTGVEDPIQFRKSSSVGAYFGTTAARYQSGEVDRAGRVCKCGDGMGTLLRCRLWPRMEVR